MVKNVIRAANNMVIAFDEQGNQMPEYQGRYEDVKRKIMTDIGTEAAFIHWFNISSKPDIVSRINW
ncbi:hypothetical protein ES703_90473 [subsurface metagenome]